MFEELIDKLENCPNMHYEAGVHFIRILPTKLVEFPVMIEWIWGTRFMVHLDGWHQDFDSYDEAAKCFMLAASGRYRLKTGNKGGQRFSVDSGVLGWIAMGRGLGDRRPLLSLLETYYFWLSPEPVASYGSARGSAGRVEHGGWVVIGMIYSLTEVVVCQCCVVANFAG
jgi:hypothetical protein